MAEHSILVRAAGSDDAWSDPETTAYSDEAHLQELLAMDPDRLPGVSSGAVAVRELPTSAGPIDVCVIEPSGEVTVVECKLSSNSEKRRTVIGQVIDYAAALRIDGLESLRSGWASKDGLALEEVLDPEALAALEANLDAGRINLCLAVDRIDDDLRRLIEHLNLVSVDAVRVTALQLTYVRHGDLEILIPSSFGAEIADRKNPRPRRERWTWPAFLGSLPSESDQEFAEAIRTRAEATERLGDHERFWFGSKPGGGIFVHITGQRYAAIQLWSNRAGELRIFGNWRSWPNLRNDERFADLARLLGQTHEGGSRGRPASTLDLDELWTVALECDLAINR